MCANGAALHASGSTNPLSRLVAVGVAPGATTAIASNGLDEVSVAANGFLVYRRTADAASAHATGQFFGEGEIEPYVYIGPVDDLSNDASGAKTKPTSCDGKIATVYIYVYIYQKYTEYDTSFDEQTICCFHALSFNSVSRTSLTTCNVH
jgi:hypothetical protein